MSRIISAMFFILLSTRAFAGVGIEGRQVYILLRLRYVWGSYLFMVSA